MRQRRSETIYHHYYSLLHHCCILTFPGIGNSSIRIRVLPPNLKMPLFDSGRRHRTHDVTGGGQGRGWTFRPARRDRDRVAGGYRAALTNPNTTHGGRRHAKRELRLMGRGNETHVPLMTKIKRTLGIRSTPRRERRRTEAVERSGFFGRRY